VRITIGAKNLTPAFKIVQRIRKETLLRFKVSEFETLISIFSA